MLYRKGHWWGKFKIPEDYQAGGHFFTVWIKGMGFSPKGLQPRWTKSEVWYRAYKEGHPATQLGGYVPLPPGLTLEAEEEIPPPIIGEPIRIPITGSEASPLLIKGSQGITFQTRTVEGSIEGYAPGTTQTREETLRLNISGRAAGIDIDATLFRSTALGVTQLGESEEKIAIRMKRGSTEVFLGDFNPHLDETEFTALDKMLSGGQIFGNYGRWGGLALYSSPKGEAKYALMYGDETQGPYSLGYAPVVINSERVYLNGLPQKRGDDYNIDYQAGTITFIRGVVDLQSIIKVYYDYRQTVYEHSLYGARAYFKPLPNLKVAATYLNDSDSLTGAEAIRDSMSQEAVNPQSHYVVGADGSFVSEHLEADGEAAFSYRDLDLLSSSSTKETGKAAKINLRSDFGPFGISGYVKRVGPLFFKIADADPEQDVTEYGGTFSFRPGSLLGAKGSYAYQKFRRSAVVYENLYKKVKTMLTPQKLPSLEYNYSETDESNDPVTGSEIRRVIAKNSLETIHQFGMFSASLKGSLEKWTNHSPSIEATDYKRINFGLAAIGLPKVNFSSNIELENRIEPDGTEPFARTYNLNLAATPSQKYFISSTLQIVDDSVLGHTNVCSLALGVEPSKALKLGAKYTINSLNEEFLESPSSTEAVSKHVGSISLSLRPTRAVRFRYLYKPNFTELQRTDGRIYNSEQQQVELNVIPVKQVLLGLIYKNGKSFSIDKDDYPGYSRIDESEDTNSTLYTIKMAPFPVLSLEFDFLQNNSLGNTLAATVEPFSYLTSNTKNKQFDMVARTSLSEKFSINTRYSYQKSDQGSAESLSNMVNSRRHTASFKGIWTLSRRLSFSISGAYTRTTDYLLSTLTYTLTPGLGFIYRLDNKLRIDFNYAHSKSYAGAETEVDSFSLKTKYALSEFVDLTLRAEQAVSRFPYYRVTDIAGNVEISL
ncbi:MAG: hypothetical protein HQ596_07085 [Candidatus Saganbacteria bacterium]|nr:hypothetical protein [Candidatus Saganbacteria bacterium]